MHISSRPGIRSSERSIQRVVPAVVAAATALLGDAGAALADHGGATVAPPMSPVLVGALVGGLTLAVGIALIVVIRLLSRRSPPSG